jgi:hypothetical protein
MQRVRTHPRTFLRMRILKNRTRIQSRGHAAERRGTEKEVGTGGTENGARTGGIENRAGTGETKSKGERGRGAGREGRLRRAKGEIGETLCQR